MKTFTNRATYINAVNEWKEEYKELSATIRAAKLDVKAKNRANDMGGLWRAQSNLSSLSYEAYRMLIDRANAKIEAQEQYLAEKAKAEVAA